MSYLPRIVGIGRTPVGRLGKNSTQLGLEALERALADAGLSRSHLSGLVSVPSLSDPHFMQGHYFATQAGLLPQKRMIVRTIDTGGAGPISAIAVATSLLERRWADAVAIVATDAVSSMGTREFLERADASVEGGDLPRPAIVNGYDRIAQWHMQRYGLRREQLAMVPVLMSYNAVKHPEAMCRRPTTLEEVMTSRPIAPATNLLECARRADGAAVVIVSTEQFLRDSGSRKSHRECPIVVGCGEGSGPLYPPSMENISEEMFSCELAAKSAYEEAQLGPSDIDFWGLYDCYPICFIRALEALKVCRQGEAGAFVEEHYNSAVRHNGTDPSTFPINTHGGLLCFGAPWEVPAMYNIHEAVEQLSGRAVGRQVVPKPRRALVYGNGGIFSASSVAILGDGSY